MPDCAWCDRELPPTERVHGIEGDEYYICSCCSKVTRTDREGVAHRSEPKPDPQPDYW